MKTGIAIHLHPFYRRHQTESGFIRVHFTEFAGGNALPGDHFYALQAGAVDLLIDLLEISVQDGFYPERIIWKATPQNASSV
jgi:hypothetical protein